MLGNKSARQTAALLITRLGMAVSLVVLATMAWLPPASAQDQDNAEVTLDSFFGKWRGTGIEEDEDELFFAVTARDMMPL